MPKVLSVIGTILRIIVGVALCLLGVLSILLPPAVLITEIVTHSPAAGSNLLSGLFGIVCGSIVLYMGLRYLRVIKESWI